MKQIFYITTIILLALANSVQAQNANKTEEISDSQKFENALKDVKQINTDEIETLENISQFPVTVVTLKDYSDGISKCDYKTPENVEKIQTGGIWVVLPSELKDVFSTRKDEFKADAEDRLKKLFGFDPGGKAKCFVEIQVETANYITFGYSFPCLDGNCVKQIEVETTITRPFLNLSINKNNSYFWDRWKDNEKVFTGLGYTCDWYKGNGCARGLTEFNIPLVKNGSHYLTVKRSCDVVSYLSEKETCK
jgi:hypothetical protein